MTTNDKNRSSKPTLNQALTDLNWDFEPERDLWSEISSRLTAPELVDGSDQVATIHQLPAAVKHTTWQPYAIAASIMLAIGSLFFSSMLYQQSQDLKGYQTDLANYQAAQLLLIEQQHQMVRVQFNLLLSSSDSKLNADFVSVAQELMNNVDAASAEIKKAMVAQPNNPDYASMLVSTYQQEIKLLNSVKVNSSNSNEDKPATKKSDSRISI